MKPENDELGNGSSLVKLASKIVAYHFCQVDNRTTCLVPDFVHSLAAQMCQAPGLSAYQTYLDENPDVQVGQQYKNQNFASCGFAICTAKRRKCEVQKTARNS